MKKYICLLIIILISCKNNNEKSLIMEPKTLSTNLILSNNDYSEKLLDNLLKCGDYSYMDGYFTVPDYGCIYQSSAINTLGNAEIYLVPRERLVEGIDVEGEEDKVGKMAINNLKENFDIYIMIIDKKYLIHNDKMDVPYYPKYPFKQVIFKWKDGAWENITALTINKENDSQYNNWKAQFLVSKQLSREEKIVELKGDYFIKTKVSSVETGDPIEVNFYFEFEIQQAILTIGTKNSLEAYCEGTYSITKNNEFLKLQYIGEGTCTSDEDESTFLVKKENNQFYIKSKRFINPDWQLLKKKTN
ncbi:hypothetical protein [Flavobacterium sp.]|uniref:hypothetical protein n=1 Tax=Flavobacterium sp. TaxID=239 RepID=UPI00374CB3B4